jgi:hypothetical protein
MATILYTETTTQFLARMILATREGQQISSRDAQRLSDHASFGVHGAPTTMPEERRDTSKPLTPVSNGELIST